MAQRINNHLSSHQNGSAPSSPSMSQSQQQGGQSRQPVSYPSPTSYPSPGLSSAQYSYPAPNQQQVSEPYRASPTGSNGSLSLPSMRSLDPLQQQTHQQHMGSPLPPPVAQMAPYYHSNQTLPHPQHQYPNVTSDPSGQNMRYALPAPDNRVMSGGRHKKEIKRRTKTGCLTCRKRRIKCDEAHPACRNCQKSKRECLGYDPIFKQQPGPAPIQPAPSSAPSQASTVATSNPYGNQPSMLQGYGAQVPNMAYEPSLSTGVSSPGSTSQQFDYSSAIDPALEAAAPPSASSTNQFQQQASGMPNFREDLKREMQSTSPYSSGADSPHLRGGASSFISPSSSHFTGAEGAEEESSTYATSPAKNKINRIDDILALGPAAPTSTLSKLGTNSAADVSTFEEIKHLYHSIYSPGLESFLESKWFPQNGVAFLTSDNRVLELFETLIDQFGKTPANDAESMAYTSSIEARVVWALACMVRTAGQESNGIKRDGVIPASDEATEAGHRLTVFENLLCGVVANGNPLTKPIAASTDHHKLRELEFWYVLGQFVTLRDDEPSSAKNIDDTLAALRNLLDGRENRDVLYSIAVVRAIGQRVSEYTETDTPLHLDEQDVRSKLAVAKRFVRDEGNGHGTTNVIRRLCELATRAWSTPGTK